MALSVSFLRKQLNLLRPFVLASSLDVARKGQDALGELMFVSRKGAVRLEKQEIERQDGSKLSCEWIVPKDLTGDGVLVYLHGGGYTCGGSDYARGFGALLAEECSRKVFCISYRLAPENPYPAAIEDVFEAYLFLLRSGILPEQILLCGESAGGGLCYSLCLKLRAARMPQPAGIIAISPWVDLTLTAKSIEGNRDKDPSLSGERLEVFAAAYGGDRTDPYVSPLFADLRALPPSLLFAGGDEILLDDATGLQAKLIECGCDASLVITPGMWHGYLLFATKEHHARDIARIRAFLGRILPPRKLRWMRLDNAAKIFPASRRRNWVNIFRLSATLTEDVDVQVLQSALDVTVRRFPSIAVRLRRGVFWYYLEEIRRAPDVIEDVNMPLSRMPFDDIRQCAFRVLYYKKRVAVEFFHAVTDGTGGTVFLKSLLAEYVTQKYGKVIPCEMGVLDRLEEPKESELEDSFLRYSGDFPASRAGERAYHIKGEVEPDRFLHLTCGSIPVSQALSLARSYNVSLTVLLAAVMVEAIIEVQARHKPKKKWKPAVVALPVNLRQLFPSETMRNFVLVTNVGVDPRKGEYTLEEIMKVIKSRMALEVTPQHMRAEITVNVDSEKSPMLKIVPLFLKNLVMRAVFDVVGEARSSISMSNLGAVKMPSELKAHLSRMDFIIGTQSCAPYNCGVISLGETVYINLIRNTVEPELEHAFFTRLLKLGLAVKIESNTREEE